MKQWNELTQVALDKVATLTHPLANGSVVMLTTKHSELEANLAHHDIVTFDYCYGQENRRIKQIEAMGYVLAKTVWRNTDAKHSRIKQIWIR